MGAITDFYTPMRVVLNDNDPQGSYEFTDDMLGDGIRCAYVLGSFPHGYALDSLTMGTVLTPDIPNNPQGIRSFAVILLESCLAMMVGNQGAFSFSTRAISQTDHGEAKRDILQYARTKLYELKDGDAVFATRENFITWLTTIDNFMDVAEMGGKPFVNVQLNLTQDNATVFLM